MNNNDFSSLDNVPLSASDSELIVKLTESNRDLEDRAALQASLILLLKQRNMLAYRVSGLLNIASAVQSESLWKATNLQAQLDQANASVELQYRASLIKDEQGNHFVAADSL